MNIEDLTLKQLREIQSMGLSSNTGLNSMLGKKVIIRTETAGVWFGELSEKFSNEVILKNARRMWRWWADESITLSSCALYGVKHDSSKIVAPVDSVWLEAIEIIPCRSGAIKSIESAPHVKAR